WRSGCTARPRAPAATSPARGWWSSQSGFCCLNSGDGHMTYNASLGFGSGVIFMTPAAGTTPLRVGILQDVSFDMSWDQKPLYGQNQWAVALARGKAKGSIKAKTAQIDSGVIGSIILGGTPTTGQKLI